MNSYLGELGKMRAPTGEEPAAAASAAMTLAVIAAQATETLAGMALAAVGWR